MRGDTRHAIGDRFDTRLRKRCRERKHGAWNFWQRRVIALEQRAARDLPVDVLIDVAIRRDQLRDEVSPLLFGVRVFHA